MISPFSLPQASLRGGQRPSGRPGGGPEGGTGAIGAAAEAGYPHGWFYVMENPHENGMMTGGSPSLRNLHI